MKNSKACIRISAPVEQNEGNEKSDLLDGMQPNASQLKSLRVWMKVFEEGAYCGLVEVLDCETEDEKTKRSTLSCLAPDTFERLLDINEAAEMLRVHPKTLQSLSRAGSVPCVRMGKYWRFRASSLDEWIRNRILSDQQSRRVS